jgi:hypothetical protein
MRHHRLPDGLAPVQLCESGTATELSEDLAGRACAAGAVLDAVPALQAEVWGVRQAVVATLRETMSLAGVADRLEISRSRVGQIVKGVSRTARG